MDNLGRVDKAAFEQGKKDKIITGMGFGEDAFALCDTSQDGLIDKEEMTALGKSLIGIDPNEIIAAAENGDDDWLLHQGQTGFTSGWFMQHTVLRPNKEVLPELNLPIYIFHGSLDMNCNVQGVYDVQQQFQKLGKTNLTAQVFQGADHGLQVAQLWSWARCPRVSRPYLMLSTVCRYINPINWTVFLPDRSSAPIFTEPPPPFTAFLSGCNRAFCFALRDGILFRSGTTI